MRRFNLIFFIIASSCAVAQEPNYYQCSDNISYQTTNKSGKPELVIGEISFGEEDISTKKTVMGTLVSIDIARAPHVSSDTVSILIPKINLSDDKPTIEFETQLINTRTNTTKRGQDFVDGVVHENTWKQLTCTAERLSF